MQTAADFYGASYARAKDPEGLDSAFKTFTLALKSEVTSIQERALTLAANKELAAFG